MLPVGPLMIEHRLIEKFIVSFKALLKIISSKKQAEAALIKTLADAMEIYTDRCHHGKEENILFAALQEKPLTAELKKIMNELINEHEISRNTVKALILSTDKYVSGEKNELTEIERLIKIIVNLYPPHIEKEDKHFFLPSMKYFTKEEQEKMLQDFWEFDRNLIHEKYKKIALDLTARLAK